MTCIGSYYWEWLLHVTDSASRLSWSGGFWYNICLKNGLFVLNFEFNTICDTLVKASWKSFSNYIKWCSGSLTIRSEPPHDKTSNMAQWRLKSAWAIALGLISRHCMHEESLGPKLPIEHTLPDWPDWTDAQADQSLRYPHEESLGRYPLSAQRRL